MAPVIGDRITCHDRQVMDIVLPVIGEIAFDLDIIILRLVHPERVGLCCGDGSRIYDVETASVYCRKRIGADRTELQSLEQIQVQIGTADKFVFIGRGLIFFHLSGIGVILAFLDIAFTADLHESVVSSVCIGAPVVADELAGGFIHIIHSRSQCRIAAEVSASHLFRMNESEVTAYFDKVFYLVSYIGTGRQTGEVGIQYHAVVIQVTDRESRLCLIVATGNG